jgi:hypothetical protein
LLAVLAASGLVACGGSGGETEATGAGEHESEAATRECEQLPHESQREECEKAGVKLLIPTRDRVAYYQLATSAGLLRGAAVAAARDDPRPPRAGRAELASARDRIDRARPRDSDLVTARRRMLLLLGPAVTGLDRARARRTLAAIRVVERSLSAYLRREPANASLLPD